MSDAKASAEVKKKDEEEANANGIVKRTVVSVTGDHSRTSLCSPFFIISRHISAVLVTSRYSVFLFFFCFCNGLLHLVDSCCLSSAFLVCFFIAPTSIK